MTQEVAPQRNTRTALAHLLLAPARTVGLLLRLPRALGLGLKGARLTSGEYNRLMRLSLSLRGRKPWGYYIRGTLLPSLAIGVFLEVMAMFAVSAGWVPYYWAGRGFLLMLVWAAICAVGAISTAARIDDCHGWQKEMSEALIYMRSNMSRMSSSFSDIAEYAFPENRMIHSPELVVYRALGGWDSLGMVRIGLAMKEARATVRRMEVDGETSELLSRVCSALQEEHSRCDVTLLRLAVMDDMPRQVPCLPPPLSSSPD